ncbi:MAG TPA: hypothetical protein VMD59_05570 [Acidimicrobiales bacterium]|nr:hypothetical protein [Acidimicrobiales bacterium]
MADPPADRPASPGEHPVAPEQSRTWGPELSRRAFLGGAAGTAGFAYLGPFRLLRHALPRRVVARAAARPDDVGILPRPDLVLTVERPEDLVVLDFSFYGFSLEDGTPPTIVPSTSDNTVVVQFPPQAVAEGEYYWVPQPNGDNDLPVDPPPILSDVAGPSWLCFNLASDQSIPLTTMTAADLLDWSDWTLVVPVAAQVNGPTTILPLGSGPDAGSSGSAGASSAAGSTAASATSNAATSNAATSYAATSYAVTTDQSEDTRVPTAPSSLQTSIEFPYALYLAPAVYVSGLALFGFTTQFTSRSTPLVSPAGVTDLWSASLGGSPAIRLEGSTSTYAPPVSAFWATDYSPPTLAEPDATPQEYIVYGEPLIIP